MIPVLQILLIVVVFLFLPRLLWKKTTNREEQSENEDKTDILS